MEEIFNSNHLRVSLNNCLQIFKSLRLFFLNLLEVNFKCIGVKVPVWCLLSMSKVFICFFFLLDVFIFFKGIFFLKFFFESSLILIFSVLKRLLGDIQKHFFCHYWCFWWQKCTDLLNFLFSISSFGVGTRP